MEMLLGLFQRCIQYERKCMHRKLERMSNKKLMKFELFKAVFRKLLLEDNLDIWIISILQHLLFQNVISLKCRKVKF